jgi:hypothetical protein
VFAVGNAAHGLQLVIMAVADGTQAAFSINEALIETDLNGGAEVASGEATLEGDEPSAKRAGIAAGGAST